MLTPPTAMIMATATAARAAPNVARTSAGGRGRLLGRAIIVLAALAASGAVLCLGIATSLARHDPIEAAQIAPDNAEIAVAAARARAGKDTVHQNREVRRLVAAALARDVTDPTSIELKSLQSGADGDHLREARLITLSDAISRRSLPTRLWLIQQAVNKGDLVGALKNFDTALRTSSDAPGVLFPALSRAASDPSLAVPVAQLLDRPSDWRLPFLHFAITDGDAASGVAGIVLHMRHRDWMTGDDLDGALVAELVSEEYFTQALAVQDSFHPVTERSALVRDPAFADPRARYPFGWLFEQKGDIGAERGRIAGRSVLNYQSLPGGVGPVGTQLLLLKPGSYRLAAKTATAPADPTAPPLWTLTCAGDKGPQIALLDQPSPRDSVASVSFSVPAGCPAQWLILNLRESDVPTGQTGAISEVSVISRQEQSRSILNLPRKPTPAGLVRRPAPTSR